VRGELVVVAPREFAAGYRLAGARTVTAGDSAAVVRHVEEMIARYDSHREESVVAVHDSLWQQVPRATRDAWLQRSIPLVLALPDESGEGLEQRQAELRELVARAVGYEITFTAEGDSP
jgi:vacuolar-type H+-ATPase subunit F/Vma7